MTLEGLRFSVVGPGRVGASLCHWACGRGAHLVRLAARRPESSTDLAATYGATAVPVEELASGGEDLLLIAVSDGALAEVAELLASRPQAKTALHVSGRLPASVLQPLRDAGSAIGALHPLRAFPEPVPEPEPELFFALDGDPTAVRLATRLVDAWGGRAGFVPAHQRPLYHLAATWAAGGVVTLLAATHEVAGLLGLPPEAGWGYSKLAEGALRAASTAAEPAAAITGPLARGDEQAVESHLAALRTAAPQLLAVAAALGLETLRQLERRGPLTKPQERIRARLMGVKSFA